jgi:hypothetical protein
VVGGFVENGKGDICIQISVRKLGRLGNRCKEGIETNLLEISLRWLDSFDSEYGPVVKSVACTNKLPGLKNSGSFLTS